MIKWYAIYTKSRWEKKVAKQLEDKHVTFYLPLQKQLKQWSDRKKMVETPLFSSYVFVQIDYKDRFEVLQTDGVVKFVTFSGKVEPVQDKEIEIIKVLLDSEYEIQSSPDRFRKGELVEITMGSLKGLYGEIIEEKSKAKLLIRIQSIQYNLTLDVNSAYLKHIST